VALAECTFLAKTHGGRLLGAEVNLMTELKNHEILFSESASRAVVSLPAPQLAAFKALCRKHRVPCLEAGRVGGSTLAVFANSRPVLELPVEKLYAAWKGGLKHYVQG
jgi:phosphoribosylformylglycinamidine synthase